MPFDAYTHSSLTVQHPDALRNMGVVPVSSYRVRRHKIAVASLWRLQHKAEVASTLARWQTVPIARDELVASLATPLKRNSTDDRSPAPQALINLATDVSHHIKDATFQLSYFDTDPILHVKYGNRTACLGIWDQGKIVAIAGPPSKWRKLWWAIS